MKSPNLYHLQDLKGCHTGNWEMKNIEGKWVPARPIRIVGVKKRLTLAWLVFTGKADALCWPFNQ